MRRDVPQPSPSPEPISKLGGKISLAGRDQHKLVTKDLEEIEVFADRP